MPRIVFFEDEHASSFSPIALLRPVFELLCGHFSVRERTLNVWPSTEWGVWIRAELAEVYQEEHPECRVNDLNWIRDSSALFINGRWLNQRAGVGEILPETAGWKDHELAWVWLDSTEVATLSPNPGMSELCTIAHHQQRVDASGVMLHYPWDLIAQNATQITIDFESRDKVNSQTIDPHVGTLGPVQSIFIDPSAELDPFVVLDARQGPIWIGAQAKIQAFTRIEGPAYIGPQTQTFRANIREGTSIGPVCRVGGEIEESILHGYANKYHDGFLGHSYVCPWVNLGALTTNSDLKNDYSNVSVPLTGESLRTDSNKVGCFIGDHTKTALCSLFNTGSSIGVMTLLLPGGELLPKHVPSFSRIWHGRLEELPDGTKSGIATARYAMGRRDQTLTPAMERLLQTLYTQTRFERQKAVQRTG